MYKEEPYAIKEHPDDTQEEIAKEFDCCTQAISKALKRNGITRKKTLQYKEQDPKKVIEYFRKIKEIPKEKIAYVDKSGIDSCLYREYAYALRGEKVYGEVLGRKFQRTNLIAGKLGNKI